MKLPMRWVVAFFALSLTVSLAIASGPAKKKRKPGTGMSKSSPIRAGRHMGANPIHKGGPIKGSATKSTRGRGRMRGRTHVAAAPSFQTHPDPERYQQIQHALAARGYFKGEANGQWQDDSVDALKRFQADQKLEAAGKIDSLTLRGLGLGPKHDGSSTAKLSPPEAGRPAEAPAELPAAPVELQPGAEPSATGTSDSAEDGAKAPLAKANLLREKQLQ